MDSSSPVTDYNGSILREGDPVTGWYDDVPYTGVVREIKPPYHGCGYRHIIVIRDDTGAAHPTFSDAVVRR